MLLCNCMLQSQLFCVWSVSILCFCFMPFRNIDPSHFAAQSVHFLPNTTQATRTTFAMYTGRILRTASCLTVHTAPSLRARERWRLTSKYSTYPVQLGRTTGPSRALRWPRRTKYGQTKLNRETMLRKQCTFAKNALTGTLCITL